MVLFFPCAASQRLFVKQVRVDLSLHHKVKPHLKQRKEESRRNHSLTKHTVVKARPCPGRANYQSHARFNWLGRVQSRTWCGAVMTTTKCWRSNFAMTYNPGFLDRVESGEICTILYGKCTSSTRWHAERTYLLSKHVLLVYYFVMVGYSSRRSATKVICYRPQPHRAALTTWCKSLFRVAYWEISSSIDLDSRITARQFDDDPPVFPSPYCRTRDELYSVVVISTTQLHSASIVTGRLKKTKLLVRSPVMLLVCTNDRETETTIEGTSKDIDGRIGRSLHGAVFLCLAIHSTPRIAQKGV